MAPTPNAQPPSVSTSSISAGIITPSSSSVACSHASAACSNNTIASDQSWVPSHQSLAYLIDPPTEDGSLHGRLASQHQTTDTHGRIEFYTASAARAINSFDKEFQPRQP